VSWQDLSLQPKREGRELENRLLALPMSGCPPEQAE